MGFLNSPRLSALCAIPAQLWLGADARRAFFTLSATALFDTAQIFLLFLVTSARARSEDPVKVTLLTSLKGREAQSPAGPGSPKKPQVCCSSIWGHCRRMLRVFFPTPVTAAPSEPPQMCFWGSPHKTQLGIHFLKVLLLWSWGGVWKMSWWRGKLGFLIDTLILGCNNTKNLSPGATKPSPAFLCLPQKVWEGKRESLEQLCIMFGEGQ